MYESNSLLMKERIRVIEQKEKRKKYLKCLEPL